MAKKKRPNAKSSSKPAAKASPKSKQSKLKPLLAKRDVNFAGAPANPGSNDDNEDYP
jgi:hypothetical protein